MPSFRAPRGTRDLLPDVSSRLNRLESLARSLAGRYGYLEMETPMFEQASVFERGIGEVTDVIDHGFIRSIYFSDPNGMALEASWWTLDATGRPADYGDRRLFADADPVPAVVELRDNNALDHTVSTKLVDGIIEDSYRPGV